MFLAFHALLVQPLSILQHMLLKRRGLPRLTYQASPVIKRCNLPVQQPALPHFSWLLLRLPSRLLKEEGAGRWTAPCLFLLLLLLLMLLVLLLLMASP